MRTAIPTNLITGFLGAGKTTTILQLLKRQAARGTGEKWAVLVNEFGEVGIDGALLEGSGATIREVAGGCMCCVAGLPMKMALNTLIARVAPDRLLIETSGLGHPQELIDTLSGEFYDEALDLRTVVTLLDPRKLADARYTEHPIFRDQLTVADIVVANKADLCDADDRARFDDAMAQLDPQKQRTGWISHGELPLDWLDLPHAFVRSAPAKPPRKASLLDPMPAPIETLTLAEGEAFARRENSGDGHFSCGWLFAESIRFDQNRLFGVLMGLPADRVKGLLRGMNKTFVFNGVDGVLSLTETTGEHDNRLEIIHREKLDWDAIEAALLAASLVSY